jgi:hypothetical protein
MLQAAEVLGEWGGEERGQAVEIGVPRSPFRRLDSFRAAIKVKARAGRLVDTQACQKRSDRQQPAVGCDCLELRIDGRTGWKYIYNGDRGIAQYGGGQ